MGAGGRSQSWEHWEGVSQRQTEAQEAHGLLDMVMAWRTVVWTISAYTATSQIGGKLSELNVAEYLPSSTSEVYFTHNLWF